MGKDGFLSAKAIGNRIKSKGLLKLKFYCQVCEKACRDENGFKCHTTSESHQRQMLIVAENPGKFVDSYSDQFKRDFLSILSRRHGTKRVFANQVYQEYISDREHLHMNATNWTSLSEFVKHLGRESICHVDETEKGWYMTWIDNSPKALERQAAVQKLERAQKDDDEREQQQLQRQIDRAAKLAEERGVLGQQSSDLKREDEQGKIKLNMSMKPMAPTSTGINTGSTKPGGTKMKMMMGGMKPSSLKTLGAKTAGGIPEKKQSSVNTTKKAGFSFGL
ncbi:domain of Kin17 curved DNA-binding protein-domain-containing protein [Phycomyces nitens]|nr:domain of Kin17 curved DNA-binding protein-domain-containing protein [Phycomyces nitens]